MAVVIVKPSDDYKLDEYFEICEINYQFHLFYGMKAYWFE